MADDAQLCPECSQPLKSGGLVLSKRDDDGRTGLPVAVAMH
ncbi:hypothetical protein [Streptomyces hyderabadensis]|nr:hypothetical protein [Streptomyces hyderabadensis]